MPSQRKGVPIAMSARKTEMLTVVAYDVRDDRRRARLVNVLEDFGRRVQYSVFECEVTARRFEALRIAVGRVIARDVDRVAYYRLCGGCRERVEHTPPIARPRGSPAVIVA